MNTLWGSLMAVVGSFMLACGTLKSKNAIYRFFVSRSRMTWGEGNGIHAFYQAAGLLLLILGVLWAAGIIWT